MRIRCRDTLTGLGRDEAIRVRSNGAETALPVRVRRKVNGEYRGFDGIRQARRGEEYGQG